MISRKMQDYLASAPDRVVIREMNGRTYRLHELRRDVMRLACALEGRMGHCERKVFGIAMRSCYEWIYTLLAIQQVGGVLLPVPIEFSDDQIGSLLGKATAVFVNDERTASRLHNIFPGKSCFIPEHLMNEEVGEAWGQQDELIPAGIVSIIHTSGTTSRPKGVMIRDEAVGLLVDNVMMRLPQQPLHYFSIVPMSLLIEQVLGVFIPVLSGGTLTLMPEGVAEYGAASGNARQYLELIAPNQPNFLYLPPKLLEEANLLLEHCSVEELFGPLRPHIITGGAKIPVSVLEVLDARGVQVFEAYGLSENSSIISLNSPVERRIGSAGKLLDGIEPKLVDGELLVKTPTLCAGYYNADDTACDLSDGYLHTGDIAELRDGYLYITGRKKHVIILSTARNISPEWVESVYKESPVVDDIIVMGEGRDEPCAVVLSTSDQERVREEMARLEHRLADFARVRRIRVIDDIASFRDQFYTVTGRPRRAEIEAHFIDQMYV
ncbi:MULTISPECIES: AMP-binding protein [Pseudomonas]|uniref:AMP-binding protein n=1 Tax=Pseudomonas TaxID=286 RepID=UPI0002A3E5D1|nr:MULTISPECIES: AMP-binding protein [Pseudomonas]MBB1608827.1 AMP-dependent synthetase [Pseudomonas sp. UMC76]MBB1637652.1 AMP-dependent synthetase [Pseudomonas sp. UME83]NTX91843.1 long-chain fatty acid--CoA ligase [Pseudomonas sp. UMA643]NTY20812.1 long-chain fatty acid--CoA ligase [Pseudomonas sp. UMC3103]NTY25795.1 long-chain fatty acid--CoA ligase [Pseudomonas sp. UMA603]